MNYSNDNKKTERTANMLHFRNGSQNTSWCHMPEEIFLRGTSLFSFSHKKINGEWTQVFSVPQQKKDIFLVNWSSWVDGYDGNVLVHGNLVRTGDLILINPKSFDKEEMPFDFNVLDDAYKVCFSVGISGSSHENWLLVEVL